MKEHITSRTSTNQQWPTVAERPQRAMRSILPIAGAALCLSMASCVMPYDGHGSTSATITAYQPGYEVRSLPYGYRREVISGSTYYYQSGNYYRRSSGGYVVIDAPRNSRHYDEYKRHRQGRQWDRRYDVEDYDRHDRRYQRGDVLTRLPDGYRTVSHGGRRYYQVGERYYMRENGAYRVVSRPY